MAGLFFARREPRTVNGQKQKTRHEGRVFVETHEERATAYPAWLQGSGRRAREVMPAAMRALVRVSAAGVA
jgi:U3 small nucleolar RNA-associated protein 14